MSVSFFLASLFAGGVATRLGPRSLIGAGWRRSAWGCRVWPRSADFPFMTIAVALLAVGIGLG